MGHDEGDVPADLFARQPLPIAAKNLIGNAISKRFPLVSRNALPLGGESLICEALNLGCSPVYIHASAYHGIVS